MFISRKMKAIRYRFFNAATGEPIPTIYTALVKPGQSFADSNEVELRRCKEMIVREGDFEMQPRRIRKRSDGTWVLVYGWPRGKSWSQGSTIAPIDVVEIITLNDNKMDREKLKTVAGYYFKDNLGAEPDTLRFTHEDNEVQEYILQAAFGQRQFEIRIAPLHNHIQLIELKHDGKFADAAALAGFDTNLEDLK
jgi:hypothetical protein